VLKVLDVYCAMTSARHYREGQSSREEAIAHIQDERGKHFDPEVVDVFIKMDIK
jgi:HD-GYP domain-containing protein (c-di-GMP phosphodiesterase class II)